MTLQLSTSELLSLATAAGVARDQVQNIKSEVQTLAKSHSHPTVRYVLSKLQEVVQHNSDISKHAAKHGMWCAYGEAYKELVEKLEALLSSVSVLDIERLVISDDVSKQAVEKLLFVLERVQNLIRTDQVTHNIEQINQVLAAGISPASEVNVDAVEEEPIVVDEELAKQFSTRLNVFRQEIKRTYLQYLDKVGEPGQDSLFQAMYDNTNELVTRLTAAHHHLVNTKDVAQFQEEVVFCFSEFSPSITLEVTRSDVSYIQMLVDLVLQLVNFTVDVLFSGTQAQQKKQLEVELKDTLDTYFDDLNEVLPYHEPSMTKKGG